MSNLPGAGPSYLVPETAKLLAKDPSKDLAVLHDLLNRLKNKELDGLIDEIQQKINALKESADKIGNVAQKMSELLPDTIGSDAAALREPVDGFSTELSDPESLVMFIMSRIAEMGEDDLHDMLDEAEKIKKRKRRARRLRLLGGVLALILFTIAIPLAVIGHPQGLPVTPPTPVAKFDGIDPGGAEQASNMCGIFPAPAVGSAEMPASGPVNLEWLRVPGAFSYSLQVTPPAGAGAPWNISTDETSKKLYMENFPAGGEYEMSVSALDATGAVLCTGVMSFHKAELGESRDTQEAGRRRTELHPLRHDGSMLAKGGWGSHCRDYAGRVLLWLT